MTNVKNKLIAVASVGVLAIIGTLLSSPKVAAQGGGPTVTIGGPLPLPTTVPKTVLLADQVVSSTTLTSIGILDVSAYKEIRVVALSFGNPTTSNFLVLTNIVMDANHSVTLDQFSGISHSVLPFPSETKVYDIDAQKVEVIAATNGPGSSVRVQVYGRSN